MESEGGRRAILNKELRKKIQKYPVFGPYRSHFLSKKSLIAAKNETKEERRKEGEETPLVHVNWATAV